MDGQRAAMGAIATDYYEVLGVARGADEPAIKLAYRQLARQHHPDVSEDKPAAERKLREINEAYSVLSDPQKRAQYDRFGHAAAVDGADTIAGVFDMFFGATRGGERQPRRTGPSPGKDLRYDVEVSAAEAVSGAERDISFRHLAACEACQGSGAKPGTSVSACNRCSGSGTMRQVRQTPRSVHLTQTTCSLCDGDGQIVSAPCHVCSGRGRIEADKTVAVTISAGTDDGSLIRIDGGGEAGSRGGADGDLYVQVMVKRGGPIRRAAQIRTGVGEATLDEPVGSAQPPSDGIGRRTPTSRRGPPWPFTPRSSPIFAIALIALIALIASAAVLYATTQRNAAVEPAAGGAIAVCAMPSAERFAADLVRGYAAKIVPSPNRFFVTPANGNACDLRFSSAPAPGKPEAAVARDGIVAIVNPLNPISRISEAQLRAVFSGSVHDWSELGGPRGVIVPFLPDAASDEARVLESALFVGISIDRGVIRRGSSADVARAVTGPDRVSRGAIGLVTFSQVIPAKMIPLAYLPPPNVLTIASGRYPLTLTITLQSESQRDPVATEQLIDFARSRDGLVIIQQHGLVPPEGF